jgi:hypothetical protein
MHTCRLTQEAHDGRLGLLKREWAAEGGGTAGSHAVVGAVDVQRLFDTGSSFLFFFFFWHNISVNQRVSGTNWKRAGRSDSCGVTI